MEVEFLPTDTKKQRVQKRRIVNKIKADLEIELGNQSVGLISRQLKKASFINCFETLTKKKNPNTKATWESTLNHIIEFHNRLVISKEFISVIVKNMPIEDPGQCGRVKDLVASVIGGFEAKLIDLQQKKRT